jgi:hypothetical protein
VFTPEKLKDQEWYRNNIISEQENKEAYGCFAHKENFKLALLFEGKDEQYREFI